jgi:hypothetical protein
VGKRSRKRPAPDRASAPRSSPRPAPVRRTTRERPPAPWGSFPLSELVILLALVLGVLGFIDVGSDRGKVMISAAIVLGSLGGLEVSVREHFAGYKSHTTLLAASAAVLVMAIVYTAGGNSLAGLGVAVATGVIVFVLLFKTLRDAFIRRSGGVSFR